MPNGLSIEDRKYSISHRVFTFLTFALISILIGVTGVYWGGAFPVTGIELAPVSIAIWILLALWFGVQIRSTRPTFGWIDMALALFLGYAWWACSRSEAAFLGRLEFMWILAYAAVFLALRHMTPDRTWKPYFLLFFVLVALVPCIVGLASHGNEAKMVWGLERPWQYGVRMSGTFGCPNHFANYMVMACLAALGIGLHPRISWQIRILAFYFAAMFSTGLFLSISRGGYLALIAGTGTFAFLSFRRAQIKWFHWVLLIVIGVTVTGVITFFALHNEDVMQRLGKNHFQDIRLTLARDAIRIWMTSPLTGTGPATFDFEHLRMHDIHYQTRAYYTHNDYLNLLSDYGVVGFALTALFTGILVSGLFRMQRKEVGSREMLFRNIGLSALAAILTHSVVDFNLHIPACALALFSIAGLASAQTRRQNYGRIGNRLCVVAMTAGSLTCAGLLTQAYLKSSISAHLNEPYEAWRKLSAEEVIARGERVYAADPKAAQLLERAGDVLREMTGEIDTELRKARHSNTPPPVEGFRANFQKREKLGRAALKFYERSAAANPLDDRLLVKQGMTYDLLERYMEADTLYDQALKYEPFNRFFYTVKGYHYLRQNRLDLAKKSFQTALSFPRGHREKGTIIEQARKCLSKILEMEKKASQPSSK